MVPLVRRGTSGLLESKKRRFVAKLVQRAWLGTACAATCPSFEGAEAETLGGERPQMAVTEQNWRWDGHEVGGVSLRKKFAQDLL